MYKDMMDTIGMVNAADPELGAAMERELTRQRENIELIASENIVSPAVMAAMGSVLTNKYAEGYPGHRYYGGCQYVDQVEQIAIDRACKLFGAKYANVQPHSGAQANLAVYFALLNVGDTVTADTFEAGEKVDVTGVTKGRGFSGVIKRWGAHRLRMTHGTGPVHRQVGSMGANSSPSRVFKNKKMAGQYGNEKVTVLNLEIVKIDADNNLIAVKGAVPGPRGGIVYIRNTVK